MVLFSNLFIGLSAFSRLGPAVLRRLPEELPACHERSRMVALIQPLHIGLPFAELPLLPDACRDRPRGERFGLLLNNSKLMARKKDPSFAEALEGERKERVKKEGMQKAVSRKQRTQNSKQKTSKLETTLRKLPAASFKTSITTPPNLQHFS